MKINLVHFLRCSKLMAAGAAGVLSVATPQLFAQDKVPVAKANESILSGSEAKAVEQVVKNREDDILKIEEFIGEAERLGRSMKYEDAILNLDQAEKNRFSLGESKISSELKDIIRELRLKYGAKRAEQLLAEANKIYFDAYESSSVSKASELASSAIEKAKSAKVLYYMGVLPGLAYDLHDLDHAVTRAPSFAARAEQCISKCEKIVKSSEFTSRTSFDEIDPNFANRKEEIAYLYDKAERLYKAKEYMKARDCLEEILIKDPFSRKASILLDKIYKRIILVGERRADVDLERQLAMTSWDWVESIPRNASVIPQKPTGRAVGVGSPLAEKLKTIIIKDLELENKDILSAINKIKELSIEKDSEGKGINITLSVSNHEAVPPVSLELSRTVPLRRCSENSVPKANFDYRVHEDMVVIGNKSIDQFETRFIPVRSSVINRVMNDSNSTKSSTGGGAAGGDVAELEIGEIGAMTPPEAQKKITSDLLREYFIQLGIPFGEEATVAYDYRTSKLIVKNTPDNIQEIEQMIRSFDVDNPLVLISSKIIEIQMNDVEELGFDWLLTHDASDTDNWDIAVTSPLRKSSLTNNKLINNMNILPNFGGDNSWNLYLTVNAIDRTDRSEVLSAPKVTAKSGTEATIQMVREMYFPDSWSDPETDNTNGTSVEITPSIPEFGDATPVGIIFTVTPNVMSNGRTIQLDLHPNINDLTGWSDYSYDLIVGDYFKTDESHKITLKMPEISYREVTTKVKVYDGQTILVGGMVTDNHTTLDDKWPILGDIPLIGRIFAHTYETSERTNLLISVTTRLINGDGVPVNKNRINGKPEFGR